MLTQTGDITHWIAFSAGLLSFFSPCVLPLIPSFMAYITGVSFADLKKEHQSSQVRWRVVSHSFAFVCGFSAVFILLGAAAGLFSGSVQSGMDEGLLWVQRIGGVLVFAFGLHMTGILRIGMLMQDKRINIKSKPSGYVGSFLVGLAFAAGWTPCIGPILGAILALAAGTSTDTLHGVALLTTYSAGLGIPFMLAGLLFHRFLLFFNRFKTHIRLMEIITGVLMIVVGALLFSNQFSKISNWIYQIIPM
ncbi:MAG: cytochrome c biogenesis CcdA family protein [Desulfuromonadaceae bacterium]|nr:cytochrome c biogenesis CcdA family protein [Desulfuromonadaceae bacterium]